MTPVGKHFAFLAPTPIPSAPCRFLATRNAPFRRPRTSLSVPRCVQTSRPPTSSSSHPDPAESPPRNAFERGNAYAKPNAFQGVASTVAQNVARIPPLSKGLEELVQDSSVDGDEFLAAEMAKLEKKKSDRARATSTSVASSGTEPGGDGDADGPPLQYDRDALRVYWSGRSSELNQRYLAFARRAGPFFATVLRHIATGTLTDEAVIGQLAAMAREGMEDLGPTYIKIGQTLSIRPDIIPEPAMRELQKLQDGVRRFDNQIARQLVEDELGPGVALEDVYSEFSEDPIAAASLAQVYRARLRETGVEVAVKVQRPDALTLCSKDMYVLSRAVSVYQKLTARLTAQKVDYDALFENFASGLYNELNFLCEAQNQDCARSSILESMGGRVYVPKVFFEYTSRRVLVTEFVYGSPLTSVSPSEMRRLIAVGQECFLQQLLQPGRALHGDPHGGNCLKPDLKATAEAALVNDAVRLDTIKGSSSAQESEISDLLPALGIQPDLYLLDWGLQCEIPDSDKPKLVLAIVHMANKDWAAVTEDFIALGFLPESTDRKKVGPILKKVLAPYVLGGGGAKAFIGDGVFSASFQDLVRDLSLAAVEIPFSIPAFYASASRAIAILEGLALVGDEDYKIVLAAYPFVTRLLLEQSGDESLRTALNEILYPRSPGGKRQPRPSPRRVIALLNNALGRAASSAESDAMLDLDAIPDDAASLSESVAFLATAEAGAIREILVDELVSGADLVIRSLSRRVATSMQGDIIIPLPLPSVPFLPKPRFSLPNPINAIPEGVRDDTLKRVAPPLSPEEDVFVGDIFELSKSVLGLDLQDIVSGATSPQQLLSILGPAVMGAIRKTTPEGNTVSAATSSVGEVDSLLLEIVDLLPRPVGFGSSSSDDAGEAARAAASALCFEVLDRLKDIQQERLGFASSSSG